MCLEKILNDKRRFFFANLSLAAGHISAGISADQKQDHKKSHPGSFGKTAGRSFLELVAVVGEQLVRNQRDQFTPQN